MRPKQSILKIFALYSLIIGLLLFCRGIKLAVFTSDMPSISSHHDMAEMEETMSCCGSSETGESLMGHATEAVLPGVGNLTLLILVVTVFFVLKTFESTIPARLFRYRRVIRDRYGSAQCFVVLVQLFRAGILHSKTY